MGHVATCVLDLKRFRNTPDMLFIDASEALVKAPNNRREEDSIEQIVHTFAKREADLGPVTAGSDFRDSEA